MSRPWSPTATELRRIEAWARHTTISVEDMALTLKAPALAVRNLVRENRWRA